MNKATSVYLDLVRFSAALIVFLGHASHQYISGGLFWQIYPYLQTAVIVFFVLSGYVIAYVVESREKTLKDYSVSRVSRMYSIVIPALLLTAVCDYIGMQFDHLSYIERVPAVEPGQALNYSLSLFFLQNTWNMGLNPGTNGPFWSLTYEVFYYLMFGCIFFVTGFKKYILVALLGLIAGPSVVMLFPIWLMGYSVYFLNKKLIKFKHYAAPLIGLVLFVVPLIVLIYASPDVRNISITKSQLIRKEFVGDYFDAILFSLHLLSLPLIQQFLSILFKVEKLIRWLASLTFSMYLFHYPIIRLISVIEPSPNESIQRWLFLYPGTFMIIALLAPYCEKQKTNIKKLLIKV